MNIKSLKKAAPPVVILILAIAITAGLKMAKPEADEEKHEFPPLAVDVSVATLQERTVSSMFQGEVRAKTNIELVTQVTGKVMLVADNFIEGGRFESGETLVQIDDSDYRVALKSAEASVASAQVDLDIELASAATNAREWQDLQNKPIEEASPLRLNKPQVDRARATLAAANAELAAAELNYDRTRISAPFAGRIMTKTAELGQFMARGASVGRVFATDAMEVRIPMTDVQLSELGLTMGYTSSPESQSKLGATVSAVFGIRRESWQGYLKNVDASIDEETRLIYATVVVDRTFLADDPQSMPLAPGLFVDVQLHSMQKLTGLQIPRTALRNGSQVYVVEQEKLRLRTGKVVYTSTEVVLLANDPTSTLNPGDEVIVSAVQGAYEGMPVKINRRLKLDDSAQPVTDAS